MTVPLGLFSRVLGRHADERFSLAEAVGGPDRLTVVVLLASILGLQAADTGAIGALAAPLEKAFKIDNTDIGLLVTVTTLVGCVATLPFGTLSDRFSRTRQLQIVVGLWAMATFVSSLSTSFAMLLISRLALGAVIAAAGPAIASLMGDLFPGDERGRLYGFILTGELIGAGIGILVAGGLSDVTSWRVALGVLALPAAVLAWAIRRYLPEPVRGGQAHLASALHSSSTSGGVTLDPPSLVEQLAEMAGARPDPGTVIARAGELNLWEAARYVLRVRTNVALIIASGFGYFFLNGMETFGELYLRERFGISQALATFLFILVAGGAVVGVMVSGLAADRLIGKGRASARITVASVAYVATALVFLPGALSTTLVVTLPVLTLAAASLGATNPPANAARLDIMPSHLWGRAEAVRTIFQQAMQGISPLIFGVLSEAFGGAGGGFAAGVNVTHSPRSAAGAHGLELAFLIMTVPLVISGAALWRSRSGYLRDVVAARRSDEIEAATG